MKPRRILALTLDVTEEDIIAAKHLLENMLGQARHPVVITNAVLHAFGTQCEKPFYTLLDEILAGEILQDKIDICFDVYSLCDEHLQNLHALVTKYPYTSDRLEIKVGSLKQYYDDDLEQRGVGVYGRLLAELERIQTLQHQQLVNKMRFNWYQLQHGFFALNRAPRDVMSLIVSRVQNGSQHPLPPRTVLDNLDRVRNEELLRRNPNGSK